MSNQIASASADFLVKITGAYSNGLNIGFIAIPLGMLIWSYNRAISYSKENEQYHSGIEDILDGRAFQQVVVPLYDAITSNLWEQGYEAIKDTASRNKKEYIHTYELEKIKLLRKLDFSLIAEADDFHEAITKLISSKKNQVEFKKLIKTNRVVLSLIVIVSAIEVLSGVTITFFQSVIVIMPLAILSFIIWLLTLVIVIGLFAIYKHNESCIDDLKYE